MNLPDNDEKEFSRPINYLQYLVNSRFSVSPLISSRAFECFTMPDGEDIILYHYVFGYKSEVVITKKETVSKVVDALWKNLRTAWPPGTFLMWRRLPTVEEQDGEVKITLRIGSFIPPSIPPISEGEPTPKL